MELSIVTTMYRSAGYIDQFYQRITQAAAGITNDFEIVFVNDGSPDESLEHALRLREADPRVTVVDLSRNFGHHHAILAGLRQAQGERVFLIDIDLEEQPEWLGRFWTELGSQRADVVFGVQEARRGALPTRMLGALFYRLFNALSDIKIPPNLCTVRLMTRSYVEALLSIRDRNLFLAGTCAWAGFVQKPLPVKKELRARPSDYDFNRKIRLFFDALSSFSSYPLRMIFLTGMVISVLSGVIGAGMLVRKLLNPNGVLLGFSSLIVSVWFLGGLMIFFLGVIGLYLSKVFTEVKDRPQFIVRNVHTTTRAAVHRAPGSEAAPLVAVADQTAGATRGSR